MPPSLPHLTQEWITLQNNHERYETGALLIKLVGVAAWGAGMAWGLNDKLVGALSLVLWAQEGIFRTFQARLGERILRVESLIGKSEAEQADGAAFQLHSEWLAGRPGGAGLLLEYARSAARPTVAFPYALLLLIGLARHLI